MSGVPQRSLHSRARHSFVQRLSCRCTPPLIASLLPLSLSRLLTTRPLHFLTHTSFKPCHSPGPIALRLRYVHTGHEHEHSDPVPQRYLQQVRRQLVQPIMPRVPHWHLRRRCCIVHAMPGRQLHQRDSQHAVSRLPFGHVFLRLCESVLGLPRWNLLSGRNTHVPAVQYGYLCGHYWYERVPGVCQWGGADGYRRH